ncbi:MAG: metallophosphoesterase [Chloroflexota bacterium]|nr:metallophosphoesterase [Chloroflexota bacterium]
MQELFQELGYTQDASGSYNHAERRIVVFLGDLGDRGPYSGQIFRMAMQMVSRGQALYTPGNHCNKLLRYLEGRSVRQSQGLAGTIRQVEELEMVEPGFRSRLRLFIESAPTYLWLDEGNLVVAHAGIKEQMIGRDSESVKRMCLYGDITGERNADGTPVRLDWAQHYRGEAAIIYGHTPTPGPVWTNNTTNIDQGAAFGGWLTAMRWPDREAVQVRAHMAYYKERTPLFIQEAGLEADH